MSHEVWSAATERVAAALPDAPVTFEWPGCIWVQVGNDRAVIFGTVNETINGNELVLRGDMWDEGENSPEALDRLETNLSSDCTDPQRIADAIVASVYSYAQRSA